jgi:hypothetical protein
MCSNADIRFSWLNNLSHISQLSTNEEMRVMMNLLFTVVYLPDELSIFISHLIITLGLPTNILVCTIFFLFFLLSLTDWHAYFNSFIYYFSSLISSNNSLKSSFLLGRFIFLYLSFSLSRLFLLSPLPHLCKHPLENHIIFILLIFIIITALFFNCGNLVNFFLNTGNFKPR